MQFSEPLVKKINPSGFFSVPFKIAVFLFSIAVIGFMLVQKKQLTGIVAAAFLNERGVLFLVFMLLAMLANISVEAIKWKYLLKETAPISFSLSLKAVFSGMAAGLITPHGIGDYIGRILFLDTQKRLENIASVLFSRVAQLCITCLTGVLATIYFYCFVKADTRIFVALSVSLLVLAVIVVCWQYRAFLLDRMKQIPWIKKVEYWFEHLRAYSNRLFLLTLLLSLLRYVIFSTQFILLLQFFNVQLPIEILLIGVVFIFFVKSIIPTFIDLGVRELAALFFFSGYAVVSEAVLAASLSLWFFNLVLPALIGLFCMFTLEYKKQE